MGRVAQASLASVDLLNRENISTWIGPPRALQRAAVLAGLPDELVAAIESACDGDDEINPAYRDHAGTIREHPVTALEPDTVRAIAAEFQRWSAAESSAACPTIRRSPHELSDSPKWPTVRGSTSARASLCCASSTPRRRPTPRDGDVVGLTVSRTPDAGQSVDSRRNSRSRNSPARRLRMAWEAAVALAGLGRCRFQCDRGGAWAPAPRAGASACAGAARPGSGRVELRGGAGIEFTGAAGEWSV